MKAIRFFKQISKDRIIYTRTNLVLIIYNSTILKGFLLSI